MKKVWLITVMLFISFIFSGCTDKPTKIIPNKSLGNPSAKNILLQNPEADIFMSRGIIYSNADDFNWVNAQALTLGAEVTEIKRQSSDSGGFVDGTATKLSVGTKIYQSKQKENIYIAVVNGKSIPYLALREG